MATVTDLAAIANATAAGYTLTSYSRASGTSSTEQVALLEKKVTGESGTTGGWIRAIGVHASNATTAKTNALAALNAIRRHRYAGSPGAASGATVVATWPDGAATVPTVDTN